MATSTTRRKRPKGPTSTAANGVSDIESRIKPVAEVSNYLKSLFYGRSGTGKTTLAGSFPTPHLLLDVKDKGTKSIKSVPGIDVLEVQSWTDLEEVYWLLFHNPEKYKTVSIDTVTQLQDLCMQKVKGTVEISKTSRQAWGEVTELMKAWIIRFRDLPLHVNFLAQPRIDTEENENEELTPDVGAGVSPGTQKILHAAVDIIGYTFIREREKKTRNPKTGKLVTKDVTEYCLRVGPHPILTTKFRRDKDLPGTVPSVLVDTTFERLIKLTEGE